MITTAISNLDTIRSMTRTVIDAASLLKAIAGKDSKDNYTSNTSRLPDFVKACRLSELVGNRVSVLRKALALGSFPEHEPANFMAFEEAFKVLKAAEATSVDNNISLTDAEEVWTSSSTVMSADVLIDPPKSLDMLTYSPKNYYVAFESSRICTDTSFRKASQSRYRIMGPNTCRFDSPSPESRPTYRSTFSMALMVACLVFWRGTVSRQVFVSADDASHRLAASTGVPMGAYFPQDPFMSTERGLVKAAEGIP
ncbi:uncharacterized protein RAG0_09559 [Rhynchosporium agropyri]|uniref:Uncharacterized protein n=1 Tax=Rhynchosporium agropyri TaxID=914238 RepID=A0A1E1KW03_9HELO|nr:uncharacterized protein RAG0_09559 [Rhynchosporium agropyri]